MLTTTKMGEEKPVKKVYLVDYGIELENYSPEEIVKLVKMLDEMYVGIGEEEKNEDEKFEPVKIKYTYHEPINPYPNYPNPNYQQPTYISPSTDPKPWYNDPWCGGNGSGNLSCTNEPMMVTINYSTSDENMDTRKLFEDITKGLYKSMGSKI